MQKAGLEDTTEERRSFVGTEVKELGEDRRAGGPVMLNTVETTPNYRGD